MSRAGKYIYVSVGSKRRLIRCKSREVQDMARYLTLIPLVLFWGAVLYLLLSSCHIRLQAAVEGGLQAKAVLYIADGLLRYELEIKDGKLLPLTPKNQKLIKRAAAGQKLGAAPVYEILRYMEARWRLSILCGTGDAAATSLLAGALTSLLSGAAAVSLGIMPKQEQRIKVIPAGEPKFELRFSSLASISTARMIAVLISQLLRKNRQ